MKSHSDLNDLKETVAVIKPAEFSLVLSVFFCQKLDSFAAWLSCKNWFWLIFFFFLVKICDSVFYI